MIRQITSFQNDWIKKIKLLQEKNRFRKKEGVFLVEGLNELALCKKLGYEILEFGFAPDLISHDSLLEQTGIDIQNIPDVFLLSTAVFESIAMRGTTENAMAVVKLPSTQNTLENLKPTGFYLLAESVEKPGNLGAILRTADACGLDALILCDEKVDAFHPQVIRNSLGAVFTVPVIQCSAEAAIEKFKQLKINVFTTFMENSTSVFETKLSGGIALVVGTEHEGVSSKWKQIGQNINIPMRGKVDSLNVSVASAVLLYEAFRQRSQS